ncbi:hypothetical protein K491DRAFT_721861 [Lophiostoma macrostomum CBS 122681]|uniref:Sensitive to high expression protein 9, mitochondrial n=1 Tax=Lophiostoma macrostomum CBS 122681 TaxID=1314788 RepID=A0A6A6SNZ3_9PLEO|nr:hypothetical protein K491DRAFT_721861 [Lophiostoma macrostomum CBS 122681]
MRPLLQHASRFLSTHVAPVTSQRSGSIAFGSLAARSSTPPSICLRCQFRASSLHTERRRRDEDGISRRNWPRAFSSTRNHQEKESPVEPTKPPPQLEPAPEETPEVEDAKPPPKSTTPSEDTIARVPAEDLPSHKEGQRWDLSKRASEIMDELLPKLAQVTHKVNTYTGTDYSSIEALRREIMEQEQLVKNRRLAIDQAKHTLDAAHAQQASAQKEVVALLERKHSWSATDLERYMTLIRSEHVNDQAVRQAKDAVLSAENALEEARSQLEKRERAQYHEEQIWSDTIRRNSTWVTFGLMGFNIFILLASLAIIEPWRRRRMVREIKSALEAQKSTADLAATNQSLAAIEAAIDATLDPDERPAVGPIVPDLKPEAAVPEVADSPVAAVVEPTVELSPISTADEVTADTVKEDHLDSRNTDSTAIDTADPTVQEAAEFVASIDIAEEVSTSMTEFEKLTAQAKDLISDRYISIRKKDLTTAVLTGAAAGCGLATLVLWALIRPH